MFFPGLLTGESKLVKMVPSEFREVMTVNTPILSEFEALNCRKSVRAYAKVPVEDEAVEALRACIDEVNLTPGLRFGLVDNNRTKTPAVKLSPGMFSGEVYTCAVLVGPEDGLGGELVGYFSEKLLLRAVALGLGTCWVAGTYDRRSVPCELAEGEKLWGVIPMGVEAAKTPILQRTIRSRIRAKDRADEAFVESDYPFSSLPNWVREGALAVKRGPSAVNQQPVNVVYKGGLVTMRLWKEKRNQMMYNDLGIAKYQFQVAAEAAGVRGFWNFGEDGEFIAE